MALDRVHERESDTWAVSDQGAHSRRVRSMFARIAGVYDFMNHLLSLNRDRAWRRRLVTRLDTDTDRVLDLCAGTGDLGLAALAAGRARSVVAADFCPEMLAGLAGKRGADRVTGAAADALSLPLADACCDAAVVGFGVRNFADVPRGLAEATRVLRPGGRLLILEFCRDDPRARGPERGVPGPLRRLLDGAVPLVGRLCGRDGAAYSYLPASMGEFLTPAELAALLRGLGYAEVFVERQTFGIAHVVGGRLKP